LIYRALANVTPGQVVPALTGSLAVASAPLFVALGHQYLSEPLQTLSAAWFLWIVTVSRTRSRFSVAAHLVAETAFAMSTKQTQPLFCIWPGIAILVSMFRSDRPRRTPDSPASALLMCAGLGA